MISEERSLESVKEPREGALGQLPVIFALAWPTMLEELMQTLVQYIDTAMVGALGTEATAAVGATSTVGWMVGSSISALGVGFLAYIAKACGAGQDQKAHRASAQAALMVCIVGTLFTALTLGLSPMVPVWMQVDPSIREMTQRYFFILYVPMLFRTASILFGTVLRAAGDTKTPMRVGVLMNLINIVLNFLLIYPSREISLFSHRVSVYGAGMGVEGAAIASAISYTVGGVLITAVLWRHPMVSPKGCSLRPDGPGASPLPEGGAAQYAAALRHLAGLRGVRLHDQRAGSDGHRRHTIANTVESAFYIPGFGMQTAAATLSGNALGAGDNDRMKRLARTILPLEVGLMTVSGALLFAFARPLMALFSSDEQVIMLGSTVLRMVAVSEPFYGVPIVIEGMMQGVGRTMMPFLFNLAGMWGVRIAGTFVCTWLLGLGLEAAWACMIAHNLLLCLLFSLHFRRGTWNPLNAKKTGAECAL